MRGTVSLYSVPGPAQEITVFADGSVGERDGGVDGRLSRSASEASRSSADGG